jgi:hypothetical protein
MSLIAKVVAAVTPQASPQEREDARAKARRAARPGDWLSAVLDHHLEIEDAFAAVESSHDAITRTAAHRRLAVLLTGHSNAEESVLYPALARASDKGHASTAYSEQAEAKMAMGELEQLPPMSTSYLDKLRQIQQAVAQHVYEEEGTWFLDLKHKVSPADQTKLAHRYLEEFERYVGKDEHWNGARRGAGASAGVVRSNHSTRPSSY